jgi:uncharacterized cupin superfamily protein
MTCVDFRDRVEELLDGLLPAEEVARYEQHAAGCEECALEFEAATKFLNFLDDDGRESIETFDALNITAEVARRVARDAVQVKAEPIPPLPSIPILRRWPVRVAAAAAVVALALVLPSLGSDPNGPTVLAIGQPIELTRGDSAMVRDGVAVRVDRGARLEVQSGRARKFVELANGSALFMTDLDEELSVVTSRGIAETGGNATFQVEINEAEELAVSVVVGMVHFSSDDGGRHRVRAGERIVLPKSGGVALVSLSRLHDIEIQLAARDLRIGALKGDRDRLEEELAVLRAASGQKSLEPRTTNVSARELDALPWKELASAAIVLLPNSRDRRYSDPERNRAMAVFFFHASKIQELTGVDNPMDGLYHPAFVARMAEPFFETLAPYAPSDDRKAAAALVQSAAKVAHGKLRDELVPTENVAVRLEMFQSMLRTTREHLGEKAAVELADGLHVLDSIASVRTWRYSPTSATDVMSFWAKYFDLVDSQRDALLPIAERYVEAALAAQATAEARLGDAAASVLYPPRRSRSSSRSSRTEERSGTAEERVDFAVAAIQAKLDIAAPRIAFETSLRALLRDDQKARGFSRFWGLQTFRKR